MTPRTLVVAIAAAVVGAVTVPAAAVPASTSPEPTATTPAAVPTATTTPVAPPAGEFSVDLATADGSGCSLQTFSVVVAPDQRTVRLSFSGFLAERGPGMHESAARKNCLIPLRLSHPPDYAYAVSRVVYRGYGDLAEGATGVIRVMDRLAGTATDTIATLRIPGPFDDHWTLDTGREPDSLVWEPCGDLRDLVLASTLRILPGTSAPQESSVLTLGEEVTLYLAWRRCGTSGA